MGDIYLNDDLLDSKLQYILYGNKIIGQIRMKKNSYELYLYEPQHRMMRYKKYEEVEKQIECVSKLLKERNQELF